MKADLNRWMNWQSLIEKYTLKCPIINLNDKKLLSLLGGAIHNLNCFNSTLICGLEDKCKESNNTESIKFYKDLLTYSRFFSDLLVSSSKDYFFREDPIENINFPQLDIVSILYSAGLDIIKIFNLKDFDTDIVKKIYAKYFFYAGLQYEMLYHYDQHIGVFLTFEFDKEIFNDAKKIIFDKISAIKTEIGFREFFYKCFPNIISLYLPAGSKFEETSPVRKVYAEFVKLSSSSNFLIEPLSWRFLNILWKIDNLIQDAEEALGNNNQPTYPEQYQENLIQNVGEFGDKYRNFCELIYKNMCQSIKYHELFNIELEFIKKFASNENNDCQSSSSVRVRKSSSIEDIRSAYDKISDFVISGTNDYEKNIGSYSNVIKSTNEKHEPRQLLDYLNRQIFKTPSNCKLESIISSLDRSFLHLILSLFVQKVEAVSYDCDEIIGVSSSGVFLGHIVNLFTDNLDRIVWMFKMFPEVLVYPVHDRRIEDIGIQSRCTYLLCDESVKTGFSIASYETYLNRFHRNSRINTHVLFDYDKSYKKIMDLQSKFYSVLHESDSGHLELDKDIEDGTCFDMLHIQHKYKGLCSSESAKKVTKEYLTNFDQRIFSDPMLDVSFLLSSTKSVLYLAFQFYNKIKTLVAEKNPSRILIFSPSDEGRVLAFMTAFLWSIFPEFDDIKIDMSRKSLVEPDQNSLRLTIDLTYNTGFTLRKGLANLFNISYDDIYNEKNNVFELVSEYKLNILKVYPYEFG